MNWLHVFSMILLIALEPQLSMQQSVDISISSPRAITGSKLEFTCASRLCAESGAVYFSLTRSVKDDWRPVSRLNVKCSPSAVLWGFEERGYTRPEAKGCESFTVSGVTASFDMAGKYRCELQCIGTDFAMSEYKSQPVELTVGDPTPPVTRFELANAATSLPVVTEATAGANVSATCEIGDANPASTFTFRVTAGGKEEAQATFSGSTRHVFYSLVPKTPSIEYQCEVYNGFGEMQSSKLSVTVSYPATHSEVSIPKEITLQSTSDVSICSVANNPPKRLTITGLNLELVEPGYPRFEEKDGFSRAYVKLKESASSAKELSFACGMDGLDPPVKASVQLVAPSSAMMTIGIVIAVVVVFVVIVVGVAVCLMKRNAANKASNGDNARYGKVNQNDADEHHPTYETNPTGKKPITIEEV